MVEGLKNNECENIVEIIYCLYDYYYKKVHKGFIRSCFILESNDIDCNCLQKYMLDNLLECLEIFGVNRSKILSNEQFNTMVEKCQKGKETKERIVVTPNEEADNFIFLHIMFDNYFEKIRSNLVPDQEKRMQFFYLFNCTIAFYMQDLSKDLIPKNHISVYRLLLDEQNANCFGLTDEDENQLKRVLFRDSYTKPEFDKKIHDLVTIREWGKGNERNIEEVQTILENWNNVTPFVDCIFQVMRSNPNKYKVRKLSSKIREGSLPMVK